MEKRKMRRIILALGLLVCVLVFARDVMAEAKSEKSSLQVKILAKEISGSFTKDGRTIYFETRKGSSNPDDDPDAPPFELDIRIMDGNHTPFMVQIASHRLMDQRWYEEQKASENMPINEEERTADFSMLPSMINSLKIYNRKHKKTRWEIKEVIKLLMSLVNENVFDDAKDSPVKNQVQEKIGITNSNYAHEVSIRRKKAFGVIFEHSAILLRIYSSGLNLVAQYSTCNHGTCATDSSMSIKCVRTLFKTNLNPYLWDLMCDTWGYPYKSHLCNGDTYQEYLSIKNSRSIDSGVCGTARLYAPNCD